MLPKMHNEYNIKEVKKSRIHREKSKKFTSSQKSTASKSQDEIFSKKYDESNK
jgi:hypothetical protein